MPSASPVKKNLSRARPCSRRTVPHEDDYRYHGNLQSNQYEKRKDRGSYHKPEDERYLTLIREITDDRPTYGYRRVTAILNRQLTEKGQPRVNHKRIYRITKLNNLLLQKHTGKVVALHEGTIITLGSNMRWCSDIFEIPCWNGDRIRVAFALDCCDREILSYLATTGGITAVMVKDIIALAIENRFGLVDTVPHAIEWLSDNGSSYTAHDTITLWDLSLVPLRTEALSRMVWQRPS